VQEVHVRERLQEVDPGRPAQHGARWLADLRIQVHERGERDVLMALHEAPKHAQVRLHGGAEVLAPVTGEHDEPPSVGGDQSLQGLRRRASALAGPGEGVDDRISGDRDAVGGDPLGPQRRRIVRGGREVEGRQLGDESTVHLFGKGAGGIARAQARFDVGYRHPAQESRQCAGHGRGGVALHEHEVGCLALEQGIQCREHLGGHARRGLSLFHHLEIVIDAHAEVARERVE